MNRIVKYTLGAIGFLILAAALWLTYSYMNAKPVDPSLRDGGQSGRDYMKYQLELQKNRENQ